MSATASTGALWLLVGIAFGLALAAVAALVRHRREANAAAARGEADRQLRLEREATSEALRREAAILHAVVEGVAEGVWVTDADGEVLRHNQALLALLPPGQEVLGKRPLFLFRNEALHAAVERACQAGEVGEVEFTLEGPRRRVVAVHVAPLGREVPGPSVAVFRDITELRRLEKVRQEFVANVSHELRTPITAILGYSETLLGGALADPAHAPQMVEIIHRQSLRLSRLVGDLLELSRLDAQKVQIQRVPIALESVTRRAAEAVAPRAEGKRIALCAEVPSDLTALGDDRALEQILLNLLDNAVKYTPEGGRISVQGALEDGRVRLAVKDSGVGIPPQHVPRLFERFYRVDPGRSRELGGTGLGLAIVKHLVSAMDGEIQVSSHPGEGSEFSVFLPPAPPKDAAKR